MVVCKHVYLIYIYILYPIYNLTYICNLYIFCNLGWSDYFISYINGIGQPPSLVEVQNLENSPKLRMVESPVSPVSLDTVDIFSPQICLTTTIKICYAGSQDWYPGNFYLPKSLVIILAVFKFEGGGMDYYYF